MLEGRQGEGMGWKKLLAYITGSVDEELLRRNEFLVTENRILRSRVHGRVRLNERRATGAGRAWEEAREEGAGGDRHHRPAGDDPRLAPQARRQEV